MDFGLSRQIVDEGEGPQRRDSGNGLGPGGLMTNPVGTVGYVAPEVLSSLPYGKEVDMFACGIVLYWSMCGYNPFTHEDPDELTKIVKRGEFSFENEEWEEVSPSVKDLISRMLDQSPYARISAENALRHPWMKINGNAAVMRKKTAQRKEENDLDYVDPETFGGHKHNGRGDGSIYAAHSPTSVSPGSRKL